MAFNPVTGEAGLDLPAPSGAAMTASALATAGGVVFGGTADRQFFALHTETGELLWQMRLNGDVSGAPITFTVGNRQYVAITAGGRTGPTTSFGPLTGVHLPHGTGVVWVFALPTSADSDPHGGRRQRPCSCRPPVSAAPAARAERDARSRPLATSTGHVHQRPGASRRTAIQARLRHLPLNRGAGRRLRARWASGTLADLFKVMSTTMPQNTPGSLTPDDYASIVALYLRQSGHAPGATELPSDPAQLAQMRINPR